MVGPPGLEPGTSRLSVERSSQLSYGPILRFVFVNKYFYLEDRYNLYKLDIKKILFVSN